MPRVIWNMKSFSRTQLPTFLLLLLLIAPFFQFFQINAEETPSWQKTLEGYFDIVETFDEIQDWSGTTHNGYSQDPNDMPKKLDGRPSIWNEYSDWTGAKESPVPWIGAHESKYLWRGTGKSLQMTLRGPEGYGPSRMATYVGDGRPDSGYLDEVHAFFMVRARDPYEETLDMSHRTWIREGNVWRLASNVEWDPHIKLPAGLKVDGQWLYQRDRLYCQELEPGQWCKISQRGVSEMDDGVNTIYVRLINGEDPNNHNFSMYHWFLSLTTENEFAWLGVFKFFVIATGFSAIDYWGNVAEHDQPCGGSWEAQRKEIYGMNFQIFNMINNSGSPNGPSGLTLKDDIAVATYDQEQGCWVYATQGVVNRNYHGVDFGPELLSNRWFGIEIRSNRGDVDGSNAETEIWAYNEFGEVIGHQLYSGDTKVNQFNHAMNKFEFGGNQFGAGYFTDIADTYEGRYYIDDFILDDKRIGPAYFALLQNQAPSRAEDINLDGQVDVLDIQLRTNVLLGFERDANFVQRSDVNLDGKVDILDLEKIVEVILGQ